MTLIQSIQDLAGVTPDGSYGPVTDAAVTRGLQTDPSFAKSLQGLLGVPVDGNWGPRSSAALKCAMYGISLTTPNKVIGSSFADPGDVAKFHACKARGFSDSYCFGKGDLGIGAWGNITREGSGPQVALAPEILIAKFGSEHSGFKQPVKVTNTSNGKSVVALVGDLIEHLGHPTGLRIDSNPDAVAALGETPPMELPVVWEFV